jgi:hypothetical protein
MLRTGRQGFDSRKWRTFSPNHNVQTGSAVQPTSDPTLRGVGLFLKGGEA